MADTIPTSIEPKADSDEFICEWDDQRDLSDSIVAATIEGKKPGTESHPCMRADPDDSDHCSTDATGRFDWRDTVRHRYT